MRYRQLLPSLLTLGALGLGACSDEITQPSPPAVPVPTTPERAVAANTWLTRRDMPLELLSQAAAVVPNAEGQSILYAIAGRKLDPWPQVPMGEVRAYNVATNTWTRKQDMPAARYGMNGAGVINGKIHVTGGFTSKHKPSASVFVYDPGSNTWTQKRDMPAPGGGGVTGVIGGKLYVVTFSPGLPPGVANFFRYNPTSDTWSRLPSPTNYFSLGGGGGVINGKFYLIAHGVLEFDPATNRWTTKGQLPGDLTGASVVMLAHLYLFGADTKTGVPVPGIFIYDPVSDTWTKAPLLTTFSHWDTAELTATRVFLNGQPRVEVVGGGRPGNNLQYVP